MKKTLLTLSFLATGLLAFSQADNPAPQPLPFSENFSSLIGEAGNWPTGFQGGRIVEAEPNGTGRTGHPATNATFRAGGSNATTQAGIHDFTGKIGIVSSQFADFTIALALNTSSVTAPQRVQVTFDAMTMRNIYDGIDNDRRMALTFQYRIGTTDAFTIIPEATYESGTTANATTGTAGQNIQPFSVILPEECSGKEVVQVRWVMKRNSGTKGERQSFAIDNVTAAGLTVTPVKLTSFTAVNRNNSINLNWSTASEKDNNYFIVSGSTDGKIFNALGTVKGSNNSNEIKNYTFTDLNPAAGINYYRLEQVDIDGTSEILGITSAATFTDEIFFISTTNNQLALTASSLQVIQGEINISDISGKVVFRKNIHMEKGLNKFTLPLADIPFGILVATLSTSENRISKKFISAGAR